MGRVGGCRIIVREDVIVWLMVVRIGLLWISFLVR